MPLKAVDSAVGKYEQDLIRVMEGLDKRLVSLLRKAQLTGTELFDATAILQARPVMLAELRLSGYGDIANNLVGEYPDVMSGVGRSLAAAGIPKAAFTSVDAQTFKQIAAADLEIFSTIGAKAMDDLRQGLYKMAVQGNSFEAMVAQIAASTVGTAKNGAPLANYARTHANTAALDFAGQVSITAGERLGTDKFEVIGPSDAATRDVCSSALSNPVRTKEEWTAAGYWGGTPGGWNCRHILRPYFGE